MLDPTALDPALRPRSVGKIRRATTRTMAEWCALVDSIYAPRTARGMVAKPNWAVIPRVSGREGRPIDVIPADNREIPPNYRALLDIPEWEIEPVNYAVVARRAGYRVQDVYFILDVKGNHTAQFVRGFRFPGHRGRQSAA